MENLLSDLPVAYKANPATAGRLIARTRPVAWDGKQKLNTFYYNTIAG